MTAYLLILGIAFVLALYVAGVELVIQYVEEKR